MAKKKTIAKKETLKGRVFVGTSKGVYPYSVLQKVEMASSLSSKQLEESQSWMNVNDLIAPPYSAESFLMLYESNSTFWRCVNQLAIDVAGLGYAFHLKDGKEENKQELARLNLLIDTLGAEESLRKKWKELLVDWGSIGYFGLEVVRNIKGDIVQLHHVPAHTIRVHKDKKKYAQSRNNKKVWFKKFGEPKDINYKTGKQGTVPFKERANELIFYKNYYPKSDYYGVPNILSAIGDVIGMLGLRDYNLAFFENFGVPSSIIILEGEWDEGSADKVSDYLNKEIKGTENAHRSLVVSQPENCKFTHVPLDTKVKEGSFRLYGNDSRDRILIAYSMPPERIGIRVTGALGSNVAEEATKIYVQSVVEPLQEDLEDIMDMILQSEIYQFKFADVDTRDNDALSEKLRAEVKAGIKTRNEARIEMGLQPYPEGDTFLVEANLVEVGTVEEE